MLTQGDGPWGTLAWTYDRIGNRLSENRDGTGPATYLYFRNAAGGNTSLLATVGGNKSYSFGPAGHLESVDAAGNLLTFVHDDEGRLTEISRELGDTAEISYDGRGFLARAQSHPTSRIFADGFESGDLACWDSVAGGARGTSVCDVPRPRSLVAVYSSDGLLHSVLEAQPTPAHHHVLYFAGRPVAVLTLDETAQVQYLTTDHLGTPVLATDVARAVEWSGGFEPFGRDWLEGTVESASARGVFLRLPGQWEKEVWVDATSGAKAFYNVHRWFEPGTGRYTRPDPLGLLWPDSENLVRHLYAYSESRPLTFLDSLGLDAITDNEAAQDCFYCIFSRASWGLSNFEAAAWLTSCGGGSDPACVRWPEMREANRAMWKGPLPDCVIAQVHVHPRRTTPRPVDKDIDLAEGRQTGGKTMTVYTIHPTGGIWRYDPDTDSFTREGGRSWIKGPKERNCKPCEGIPEPN